MSYDGPFVSLGNMWFDEDPPRLSALPEGPIDAKHGHVIRRSLLADRKEGRMELFEQLPDYLDRHRNGLLWRGVTMLYAFAMSVEEIEGLARHFEDAIFTTGDRFAARWLHDMFLFSGVPRLVAQATLILPYLKRAIDIHDVARGYAIVLEAGVGFDPKSSRIVAAAESRNRFTRFVDVVRKEAEAIEGRFGRGNMRVHSGVPFEIEPTLVGLLEVLRSPYFFLRIGHEKTLIEAYTGYDLSSGYDKLQLQAPQLREALVNLSETCDLARFEPGGRYFLGEPV